MSQHKGMVTSVAFSPVGRVVATASTDGTIRLWRPDNDATPTKYDAGRPLTAVEFDATGDHLAAAGVDGQVTIGTSGLGDRRCWRTKITPSSTASRSIRRTTTGLPRSAPADTSGCGR